MSRVHRGDLALLIMFLLFLATTASQLFSHTPPKQNHQNNRPPIHYNLDDVVCL